MIWSQNYDPLNNPLLSTLLAALPIVALLGTIGFLHIRIHWAALGGLAIALAIALFGFDMPWSAAAGAGVYGAAYGLFPIGWIILNLIFLYELTVRKGYFEVLRQVLGRLAPDPRVQVILIAFCFGAFFEGAAGFGTPVAVTAAILIQLGFRPLAASGLSLIANTAPVAFGSMGTPIIALAGVTGLDLQELSAMVGRQLPVFSVLVPFWVVWAMCGFRGMLGVWPVALVAGVSFAVPQFLISNFHGPWLVDIVASLTSIGAVMLLLRFWSPRPVSNLKVLKQPHIPLQESVTSEPSSHISPLRAFVPWLLLSSLVFLWGIPAAKRILNGDRGGQKPPANYARWTAPGFALPGLDGKVRRIPPVAPEAAKPETAVFKLNWASATGTSILVSAILAGIFMGVGFRELGKVYLATLWKVRHSLITIAAMLSLGYVTKYSGADATLGLAMANTGAWYPFFGTLLGWLGVALTGSDTASNVLFGSLQKITAEQLELPPVLMAAANSSGGVMGKMVDAQSIVVASTATKWYGHEGEILRFVFWHSLVLASLVGVWVTLQAYVF